jgi:hypothetical protein
MDTVQRVGIALRAIREWYDTEGVTMAVRIEIDHIAAIVVASALAYKYNEISEAELASLIESSLVSAYQVGRST